MSQVNMFGNKILIVMMSVWTACSNPKNREDMEECRLYSTSSQAYAMPLLPNIFPFKLRTELCTKPNPLIVGGSTAQPSEFPHMAALGYENIDGKIEWLCGGSLISSRYILTAAHCIKSRRGEPRWVQIGVVNLENSTVNNRKVESTSIYPDYDSPAVYNDIALIKLEQKVISKPSMRPVCLPTSQHFLLPGSEVIATGWGRVGYGLPTSRTLMKVSLKIVEEEKCKTHYSVDKFLPRGLSDRQFCAGPYNDISQDTCQGDSGGPVQVTSKDDQCIQFLVGITSFGKYCGSGTPGVYIRVGSYLPWIQKMVWPTESLVK